MKNTESPTPKFGSPKNNKIEKTSIRYNLFQNKTFFSNEISLNENKKRIINESKKLSQINSSSKMVKLSVKKNRSKTTKINFALLQNFISYTNKNNFVSIKKEKNTNLTENEFQNQRETKSLSEKNNKINDPLDLGNNRPTKIDENIENTNHCFIQQFFGNEAKNENEKSPRDSMETSFSNGFNQSEICCSQKSINENELENDNNWRDVKELEEVKKIVEEFYKYIDEKNALISKTDKFMKVFSFFIEKKFTEEIRFIYYQCINNYGLPRLNQFKEFYEKFSNLCIAKKLVIPQKTYVIFYNDYLLRMLLVENLSEALSEMISLFFFNGYKIERVLKNIHIMNEIKENNNKHKILNDNNIKILFKGIQQKLNINYNTKKLLTKILSNISIHCEKNGYLNLKEAIKNDKIIFNGMKINKEKSEHQLRTIISDKIFSEKIANDEFNNIIENIINNFFEHYEYFCK